MPFDPLNPGGNVRKGQEDEVDFLFWLTDPGCLAVAVILLIGACMAFAMMGKGGGW